MHELPDGFRPGDPTARHRLDHGYSDATFECMDESLGEKDSNPWLFIDVDLQQLGIRGTEGGFLSLEFREGVTRQKGEELAELLRQMLMGISLIQFRS